MSWEGQAPAAGPPRLAVTGSRVVVRHYTYNGFAISVNWTNDIDFENLTLRTGPGVGIGAHYGGGYRGFRLANSNITRGPGRLISIDSDVLDLTLQADVIVENNDIGYQGPLSIEMGGRPHGPRPRGN